MTYVDAHVHIHGCFSLPVFLDSAWGNFSLAARASPGIGQGRTFFVLVLMDPGCGHPLRPFRDGFGEAASGGWHVAPHRERSSLRLIKGGSSELIVVAGRQIVTDERLEVLAFPLLDAVPHGRPLRATVDDVLDRGGIPVVPWGLGKWWFRRRGVVDGLLRSAAAPGFCLGDNGNRPRRGPLPGPFRTAVARSIPVLAGSDPLPLPDHARRAASYGFHVPEALDLDYPARGLKRLVEGLVVSPATFGERASLTDCLWSNVRLRIPSTRERR